ncbi:MAG: glycosyltransferase [Lachnospiraceae bacterium]|nr:glycosyltransferase [Lachnospiraceae bacterium]
MEDKSISGINLLFPVLNEHKRLRPGIEKTIRYMTHYCEKYGEIDYRCTILDNGSDDDTPDIARALCEEYPEHVFYVRIEQRGVGIAFRTGVESNEAPIVGYMDIDLSTDINYLGKTIHLFEKYPELDYVNGTRFSPESKAIGRKWYRKITSAGLVFLLKTQLGMKATDGICGFTFMRKDVAKALVAQASDDNGWFYMIEILLLAERAGYRICDLPVTFTENYDTTVKIGKTIRNYLKRIAALKKTFAAENSAQANLKER